MVEQAVFLYILIVIIACTILTGTILYALKLGIENMPRTQNTKQQYQAFAIVLGVMSVWGMMILFV